MERSPGLAGLRLGVSAMRLCGGRLRRLGAESAQAVLSQKNLLYAAAK